MIPNNCKYYDEENGWCKYLSDWSNEMPTIAYCVHGPCPHYQSKGSKIEFNAKYRIGDEVWFAEYLYDTLIPCEYPGTIYQIEVVVTEQNTQTINYLTRVEYGNDKECGKYAEQDCFGSYEECQRWCDAQNEDIDV